MSELAQFLVPTVDAIGTDLSARAGRMALRVADVLALHCTPESGAPQAISFLRDWAQAAIEPHRPPLDPPLERLVRGFRLSADESDLLVLAGLPEEHEGLAAIFRSLHPYADPRPTAGLAALLLGGGLTERSRLRGLLTSGPAVTHRLLQVGGDGPFFERSLVLADELWSALRDCDAWPAAVTRVATTGPPPGLDSWLDQPDVGACVLAARRRARVLLVVPHDEPAVGLARCEAIAAAAGSRTVAAIVPLDDPAQVHLVLAHAITRGAVPLFVLPERAGTVAGLPLGDFAGPVLVTGSPGALLPPTDRAVLVVSPQRAPVAALRAAWSAALPSIDGQVGRLAARHPLDPAVTAQLALDLAIAGHDPDPAHVSEVVRSRTGVNLPPGARLVVPEVPWSQLVLPQDALGQLRAAVDRLDQQDVVLDDWGMREHTQATSGVRMLFSGPPGTGKSLAAAALATAAQTDLMVVDVSRLVSKWLGETEKNLAATFDAAERTRAVLLLDEADALFGTRTEISDAHDRYANLETAYLLQRIERFDGLVVLTSNLRQNIDPAFTRRLDYVIDFPLPDVAARIALWQRCLPAPTLGGILGPLDLEGLARLYPIPGGWIRNAAVAAAFTAAASGEPITQRSLVEAVRREYLKASTPFPGEPARRRDDHD